MTTTTPATEWDVVIAGAGPTGLTLANHLGTLGVRTLVLEQLPKLIDYPRGVGVDDEALRSFQAVGLVDEVRRHTVPNQIMRFVDRKGRNLASIEPTAEPFGWPRRNGFIQPLVDAELARGLQRFAHVELRMCSQVESFTDHGNSVTVNVRITDEKGEPTEELQTVTTRFLVGSDGGRSPVRNALGLPFDGKSESTRWLVIDIADDPVGTPNVYFVLNDEFPYVELALPHGVRRYEFMVPAGADAAEYESPQRIQQLLARVMPAHVRPNVIRSRVYMHHARIAPTFRKGSVFLAGDAAHLMPVWQGQGFNTGIRDATNLAWKLALVLRGHAGDSLLDTYTQERHSHAGAMIDLSVLVGKIFVPAKPVLRKVRNVFGPLLSYIPPLRRYIAEMRFKPMPFFSQGVVVHEGKPNGRGQVGKMFPQPRVTTADGKVQRLDDVIGLRFSLICWSARVDAWLDDESRALLARMDTQEIVVRPTCQALDREPPANGIVVSDTDGEFKRFFDTAPGAVVILRPDRIVAAVCYPWQLRDTLRTLGALLQIDPKVALTQPAAATPAGQDAA